MGKISLAELKKKEFNWSKSGAEIAIVGFGIEGESTHSYLLASGVQDSQITIYDSSPVPKLKIPEGCKFYGGEDYITKLNANKKIDVIFRSPPINPSFINSDALTWSATNEFFARCPALTIGVTGTKGKGTTSSLIHQILVEDGRKSHLLGNIGQPALSEIAKIKQDDYVVFELSSFQLWDIKFSPQIAVILMVTEDHLDIHDSLNNYHQAKSNIVEHQKNGDVAIYFAENSISTGIIKNSKASKKMPFPDQNFAHISNWDIKFNEETICSISDVKLVGKHNLENVMAAVNAAKALGLSTKAISSGIKKFKGLPHRLQFIKSVGGIDFYDNSQATGPDSVRVSIEAFNNNGKVILMGGKSKGVDFNQFFTNKFPLTTFIFYGESSGNLADIASKNRKSYLLIKDLAFENVVGKAYELAKKNKFQVVILSPGLASFDMFKDYIDRGNQFIDIVNSLE